MQEMFNHDGVLKDKNHRISYSKGNFFQYKNNNFKFV
jgi:hypothetical protein